MKKLLALLIAVLTLVPALAMNTAGAETETPSYLQPVININETIEVGKSTIFDASQSFIPDPEAEVRYEWGFGDGNKNEGVEVLHAYKEPGRYTINLRVHYENEVSEEEIDVFVYRKLVVMITDREDYRERIKIFRDIAQNKGVHLELIESFGSSTEFISEEILTKKLNEEAGTLQRSSEIIIWTKENAGLNALSRFVQNPQRRGDIDFLQKTILLVESNIRTKVSRAERQFSVIEPGEIIIAKEASIDDLLESSDRDEFILRLNERGRNYEVIDSKSGKIRPWNFMSYFVNILINNGIPDNTIALLLLLPVIATVVAFMRQVVGVTTFGIYTPSIMTLSFIVIGLYAGLLTLAIAITIGILSRPLLRKVRMLFIPKMAIVITLVSLSLLILLIASIYLNLFDAHFLSIAIFPMVILSTLVEKFVSSKGEKSFASATTIMIETVIVAIIAYFIAGGEIDFGIFTIKMEFIKNLMLNHPEMVFAFILANIALGKWSGLRVLERVRFREVLRHIEE